MSIKVKICEYCSYENASSNTRCSKCGRVLAEEYCICPRPIKRFYADDKHETPFCDICGRQVEET